MTSVKARQSQLNNKITKEQCEIWAGIKEDELGNKNSDGTKHPITGEVIKNPDSTASNSLNVLISNACASKFGIYRHGNPYQPNNTISAKESINTSTPSLLSSKAQDKNYEFIKDILFSNTLDDLSKIYKLIDWNPGDNNEAVWHPPYFGKDAIAAWMKAVKENDQSNFDTFPQIMNNFNNLNIYSGTNYKVYFKTIIYAFICGYNLNIPPFRHEIPKQFIKVLKKVFVHYKISSIAETKNILKDFGFLFYPANIGQNKRFDGTLSDYNRKIYESNTLSDIEGGESYILKYFKQTVRKYNRSYQSLLQFERIIQKYDLQEHNSLSSPSSETDMETSCIKQIRSITNENFKTFKNNMIKTCKKYSDIELYDDLNIIDVRKRNNENFKLLTSKINDYLQRKYNASIHTVVYIDMKTPLKSLFEKYLLNKEQKQINILHLPKSLLSIKVESKDGNDDIAIDAGGLKNQLFNDIAKELFEKQIFIKSDLDNAESEKYFINPKFKIQDIGIQAPDEFLEQALTDDFWIFIGSLFQFFIINNYKFPHQFSSFILSGLLNEHFIEKDSSFTGSYTRNTAELKTKKSDFLYYMMRDFPQLSNILINVINYDVKDADITLNSFLHLAKRLDDDFLENKEVYLDNKKTENGVDYEITDKNYENYLHDLAKNIYLFNPIKDDNQSNLYYTYVNFFSGITSDIQKGLRRTKTTLDIIDDALTSTKWTEETVNEFIKNIINNTEILIDKYYKNNTNVQTFFDEIKSSFASKLMVYFPEYNDKAMLAKFWSGWEDYNQDYKYQFNIDPVRDKKKYPASHTCYTIIDVSIEDNVDNFWEKLKYSVNNTFNVFTAMGGKKSRKPRK